MNEEIKIKKDVFEKLCALQCDIREIASTFGCSLEYLKNWCKQTYNEELEKVYSVKIAKGKISLRSLQFRLAEKSPTMAIYLGKIYLNQDDKNGGNWKNESKRN